ncbi:MAG: hypothetical protein QNK36_14675 [Colwellia sp.]|nr:hypothetical protein [Colwellia sp.]
MEYPEASYAYSKVSAHPHYMLDETILLYSFLIFLFVVGYLLSVSLFKNSARPIIVENNNYKTFFEFAFYFSVLLSVFRIFVLGETMGGEGRSGIFKYLFFLDWILSLKLLYLYLLIHEKKIVKKIIYTILIVFTIIASGMKGGVVVPILTVFFVYLYKNNNIKIKYFIYIFTGLALVVLSFPFVFQIVNEIRATGSLGLSKVLLNIDSTLGSYQALLGKIIKYIYYRLSLVEELQVILQYYGNINRDEINIFTFIVHIYNAFVPSFMESSTWYYNYAGNRIYPIIFFGMGLDVKSSEALTIPGLFVFYFGWFSPMYIMLFGSFIGYTYMKLTRLKNSALSSFFSIYFLIVFFKFLQAASIQHLALAVKESIAFLILLFVAKLFMQKFKKRKSYQSTSMA